MCALIVIVPSLPQVSDQSLPGTQDAPDGDQLAGQEASRAAKRATILIALFKNRVVCQKSN
jgi:hypothetical protein